MENFRRRPDRLELDTGVPVLVLKIGRYVIHHGTLGIFRSLGRLGVPVYAIVPSRLTPVATSRYLTRAFVWDTTGADRNELLRGIASIGHRIGRRAILMPADDASAAFVAESAGELAKWFLFPRVAPDLPRRMANKRDLYHLCQRLGIPCPHTEFPSSFEEAREFAARAAFPVVVKAADSRRLPKGARSTAIARSARELLNLYQQAEIPENPNLLFQEYIPHSCSEDWIFHGYFNALSDRGISFTGRKLRSYPPFAGITTLGVAAANETVQRQAEKLLRSVEYSGIMDIDYRLDGRDGQYKLLDFNPRIGANFRMFEQESGLDVVRAQHLDLTGRPLPDSPMVEGRKLVVEPYDAAASLYHLRRSGLGLRAWWGSLRGKPETACFDWRDPLPCATMLAGLILRAIRSAAPAREGKARESRVPEAIPVSTAAAKMAKVRAPE